MHSEVRQVKFTYIVEYIFKRVLTDPSAYHIVLDSSRLGIYNAAEVIIEAVRLYSRVHEYVPGIRDRRSIDRRKGERRKSERRDSTIIWTHRDLENAFIHDGRPIRMLNKPDRRQKDRRTGGRRAVLENR